MPGIEFYHRPEFKLNMGPVCKGLRNRRKLEVLLLLYDLRVNLHSNEYLTAAEIRQQTDVSRSYLLSRLPVWTKWRYVTRVKRKVESGHCIWTYRIGVEGIRYVDMCLDLWYPFMADIVKRLSEIAAESEHIECLNEAR